MTVCPKISSALGRHKESRSALACVKEHSSEEKVLVIVVLIAGRCNWDAATGCCRRPTCQGAGAGIGVYLLPAPKGQSGGKP